MLDEMTWQNTSKFEILFLEYENPCRFFFYFSFGASLFFPLINALVIRLGENIVAPNEKQNKKLHGFSYLKMGNFEAFCRGFSSSIRLLFLMSLMYV